MVNWIEKAKYIPDIKEQAAKARMFLNEALNELGYSIPQAYQMLADKLSKIIILRDEIKILQEEMKAIADQAHAAKQNPATQRSLLHAFRTKQMAAIHKQRQINELGSEAERWLKFTKKLRDDVGHNIKHGHKALHKIQGHL